jgi:murein DD-endopeptidase MepM/ murein hydrolase activator NlpD
MSCCPEAPQINVADVGTDEPSQGAEVERIPGESEDCYVKRAGNVNSTGSVGDKTEEVADKIAQNSVVPDGTAAINLQFTMSKGSQVPDHWVFEPASVGGVTGTSSGLFSGTFDPNVFGTKLQIRVKAMKADNSVIDDRTYSFSPTIYDSSNSIKLQHPLPGSITTSKFGPRKPPATGASSNHFALDFAYGGGTTKDVCCAADGEVTLARPGSGYGNYVMVKHKDASGKHLITTLYAHMETLYVKVGQKVSAGQTLGKEGNTGIGSGAHLHFEVRLPDDTKVDPTPYLNGGVQVANGVRPNNTPDDSGTSPPLDGGKAITKAEVDARQSCEAFGTSYPAGAPGSTPPPESGGITPPPGANAFEKTWFYTMTHEVSPRWGSDASWSPTDADVAAGKMDTSNQKLHVGYLDHPKDPGGLTKFGVAQRYNPNVQIFDMSYEQARSTGYNVYWLAKQNDCSQITSGKIACMAFDMNYALGPGTAKALMQKAGITGNETGAAEIAAVEKLGDVYIAYYLSRPADKVAAFGKGWTARVKRGVEFAKTV